MRNLSDLFGGKVSVDVDQERRSLDDEILGEYMDQEWRHAFLDNEVGLLTIIIVVKEKFWHRYNLVATYKMFAELTRTAEDQIT